MTICTRDTVYSTKTEKDKLLFPNAFNNNDMLNLTAYRLKDKFKINCRCSHEIFSFSEVNMQPVFFLHLLRLLR